jgi:hypothetical protein
MEEAEERINDIEIEAEKAGYILGICSKCAWEVFYVPHCYPLCRACAEKGTDHE